jgi:hypothetical protein
VANIALVLKIFKYWSEKAVFEQQLEFLIDVKLVYLWSPCIGYSEIFGNSCLMNDLLLSTDSAIYKMICKNIVPKIMGVICLSTAYKPLIKEPLPLISHILCRYQGLQILYTIDVLMVRNPKIEYLKSLFSSIAGELCFTESGTVHCPCLKIWAFVPLTN